MADVFVSYSHEEANRDFVLNKLVPTLKQSGLSVWVDKEGIRPTAEWIQEIYTNILGANNFLFVLSVPSLSSQWCQLEIAYARQHNKRLVPVVFTPVDDGFLATLVQQKLDSLAIEELGNRTLADLAQENWLALKRVQQISFDGTDTFEAKAQQLIQWLKADIPYLDIHTALEAEAVAWIGKKRDLLRGSDLRDAEEWLMGSRQKEPQPTADQVEYIAVSRRASTTRQRLTIGALATGLIVLLILTIIAIVNANSATNAQGQAQNNASTAVAALATSQENLVHSESRRLAAASSEVMQQPNTDKTLAILLAAKAIQQSDTPESYSQLIRSLGITHIRYRFPYAHAKTMPIPPHATFSPDGRYVLAYGDNNTPRLWDVQTGLEVRRFAGSTSPITSLSYSPDGRFILTGSTDDMACLWNVETGKQSRCFAGHDGQINAVAFSPDGKFVLTGSSDKTARLWNVGTGTQIQRFDDPTSGIVFIAFSPDGQRLLTQDQDNLVQIWKIATNTAIFSFQALSASFSPDSQYILAGINANTVSLLTASTGQDIHTFVSKASSDTSGLGIATVFSADRRFIAITFDAFLADSISGPLQTEVWNTADMSLVATVPGMVASFSPDGQSLATITTTAGARQQSPEFLSTMHLWNITTKVTTQSETRTFDGAASYITFSPDGTTFLSGSAQNMATYLWQTAPQAAVRQFNLFNSPVQSIAFSPDRVHVAVGGEASVVVVNVVTGLVDARYNVYGTGPIQSLSYSPNGHNLVTASLDMNAAKIIESNSGKPLLELSGGIYSAVFSPDGRTVLTGSAGNSAYLFDAQTGQRLKEFIVSSSAGMVTAVTFSPDGRYVLATNPVSSVAALFDAKTGDKLRTFQGTGIQSFMPDGRHVLITDVDGVSHLVDIVNGQETLRLLGGLAATGGTFGSATISGDGHFALTGSESFFAASSEDSAELWDLTSGLPIIQFSRAGESVAFSPDSQFLATGSVSGIVGSVGGLFRLYNLDVKALVKQACTEVYRDFTDDERILYAIVAQQPTCPQTTDQTSGTTANPISVTSLIIPTSQNLPSATLTATSTASPTTTVAPVTLTLIAIASPTQIDPSWTPFPSETATATSSPTAVPTVTLTPSPTVSPTSLSTTSSKTILTGSLNGKVQLWDAQTGDLIRTMTGHTAPVNSVAFSTDGKFAASGSDDGTARLWEVAAGQEIRQFSEHVGSIHSVTFSPNGKLLLTADNDGAARLWEVATGRKVFTLSHANTALFCVAFSPDGTKLVTTGDATAILWDVQSGKQIRTFEGHQDVVSSAAFSPDGRTLLTGSWDDKVILWDVNSGKPIRTFVKHSAHVRSVAFSPDGKQIATGGRDPYAFLWEVSSGTLLNQYDISSSVNSVAFSPDGTKLVIAIDVFQRIIVRDLVTGKRALSLSTDADVLSAVFSP